MFKDKFGFQSLAAKSFAVLSAALSVLSSKAAPIIINELPDENSNSNFEDSHRYVLKPKLILKLNLTNPENSLVLMHRSHSSHSSHSSHRSHSSHYSSSYSSKSTYTPPSLPSYTPPPGSSNTSTGSNSTQKQSPKKISISNGSTSQGIYTQPRPSSDASKNKILQPILVDTSSIKLGDRNLQRGCEGKDVEELQRLLSSVKKDITVTGYFGNQTEGIIIKFQEANELNPNGIVDSKTLDALKKKANGTFVIK